MSLDWVVDTALEVDAVGSGVERAVDLTRRASGSALDASHGASGLHRMGLASRSAAYRRARDREAVRVSGELYHSDVDREAALSTIDRAVHDLRADVEPRATAVDTHPATAQWWRADVLPVLSDWALFREHSAAWSVRVATEWSTYEAWLAVLRGLRSGARAQGIVLASPEPPRLPQTILERGQRGVGGRLEAAWTLGRVLLYTAVGVAGVAGLYTVWRDLRSPGHPTEHQEDDQE